MYDTVVRSITVGLVYTTVYNVDKIMIFNSGSDDSGMFKSLHMLMNMSCICFNYFCVLMYDSFSEV